MHHKVIQELVSVYSGHHCLPHAWDLGNEAHPAMDPNTKPNQSQGPDFGCGNAHACVSLPLVLGPWSSPDGAVVSLVVPLKTLLTFVQPCGKCIDAARKHALLHIRSMQRERKRERFLTGFRLGWRGHPLKRTKGGVWLPLPRVASCKFHDAVIDHGIWPLLY